MEEQEAIVFLEKYKARTDRWWFYNYVGREIQVVATVISFGERKKKNGQTGKTILLKDVSRVEFGVIIERDYCDHLWIPCTKKLNTVQKGEVVSLKGKVRVYESGDQKSFGLKKIRKCNLQ